MIGKKGTLNSFGPNPVRAAERQMRLILQPATVQDVETVVAFERKLANPRIYGLMMAYGIRGISAAELLLDDIDWQCSRIRIRAKKGGKEVVLPLIKAVGEAIIGYLRHRFSETPFREVFLRTKAPFRPLSSLAISMIVRRYMEKAGVKRPGGGSTTLRHSWAIRALAHDTSIKSIANVLGHRYIDTTFIYAKADLKSLREVVMPWPKKG
jgi:integrase/recombinase XerD